MAKGVASLLILPLLILRKRIAKTMLAVVVTTTLRLF